MDLLEVKLDRNNNYELHVLTESPRPHIAVEPIAMKAKQVGIAETNVSMKKHTGIAEKHDDASKNSAIAKVHRLKTPPEVQVLPSQQIEEKIVHITNRLVQINFIPKIVISNIKDSPSSINQLSSILQSSSSDLNQNKFQSFRNLTQPVSESLDATLTLQNYGENIEIEVKFNTRSKMCKNSNQSSYAIEINQKVIAYIKTPSIVSADESLQYEYFVSLAKGLQIEFKVDTNKPVIVL